MCAFDYFAFIKINMKNEIIMIRFEKNEKIREEIN